MNEMTINNLLCELVLSDKAGTTLAYTSAVRKVRQILGKDATLSEVFFFDGIRQCEKFMRVEELDLNTISFYMRTLRAIYNKGVEMGVCTYIPHLFDGVYTGVGITPKRAISARIFGQLQELEISDKKNLVFARDMFLLSYCLQGIAFVDLTFLRKSNLKGDVLTYHRAKTGSAIVVALPDLAIEIIRQYAPQVESSPYLLPVIKNSDKDVRLQHRSALRTYNRRLQKLAELAGIDEKLTSYVARHTWATTARNENVPIGLISEGLGHQAEKTTRVYLAGFDHSALLQANEKVLKAANLVCRYKTTDKVDSATGKAISTTEETTLPGGKENVSRLGSERQSRKEKPKRRNGEMEKPRRVRV